ncbi:hypothetical protein COL52_32080, partial [Bacillus toyonensis]
FSFSILITHLFKVVVPVWPSLEECFQIFKNFRTRTLDDDSTVLLLRIIYTHIFYILYIVICYFIFYQVIEQRLFLYPKNRKEKTEL